MAGVLRLVSEMDWIGDDCLSAIIFCFPMFPLPLAVWTAGTVDGMLRASAGCRTSPYFRNNIQ
jgi:hypothetical protein